MTTTTGSVTLRPDPTSPGDFEVLVNGVPSSHVAADPTRLEYEYMRWIAAYARCHVEAHLDPSTLRVTHLGGAGCSLPRWCCATWPRSRNTVIEIDPELTTLVRTWFALPRSPHLKIRVGEASKEVAGFRPASRDIIIRDVFAGAVTPNPCTTVEFFRHCAASLSEHGVYLANCGDHRDLQGAKAELAGMREAFRYVGCIADPAMLKGRRYGNIVLIGTNAEPLSQTGTQQLIRELLQGAVPAHYRDHAWSTEFAGATRPRWTSPPNEQA